MRSHYKYHTIITHSKGISWKKVLKANVSSYENDYSCLVTDNAYIIYIIKGEIDRKYVYYPRAIKYFMLVSNLAMNKPDGMQVRRKWYTLYDYIFNFKGISSEKNMAKEQCAVLH